MTSAQEQIEMLPAETKAPPPVDGGTEYIESLGRFVDDLMGDSRMRERTRRELEPFYLRDEEMPEDPPPVEPPPPVPGVTEDITRGDEPLQPGEADR